MEYFICKKCNENKSSEKYFYRNMYKDKIYRTGTCKVCLGKESSERRRQFRKKNLQEYQRQRRESATRYRNNHPEKHYALMRKWKEEKRKKIMVSLGGLFCKNCKFNDYRALQIDHVKGGGNKQRKALNSTHLSIRIIEKDIEKGLGQNYQILCANCNWIKRSQNKNENNRKY